MTGSLRSRSVIMNLSAQSSHPVTSGYRVDISRGQRIGRVSSEWFSRPDDERYLSLGDLYDAVRSRTERAQARTVESSAIRVEATRDNAERLELIVPGQRQPVAPTHWSYGQLCSLVGAPATYMRQLPAPLAAINLQHGLLNHRAELVKTLEMDDGRLELRAVTGPEYGRYLNSQAVSQTTTALQVDIGTAWAEAFGWRPIKWRSAGNAREHADERCKFRLIDEECRILSRKPSHSSLPFLGPLRALLGHLERINKHLKSFELADATFPVSIAADRLLSHFADDASLLISFSRRCVGFLLAFLWPALRYDKATGITRGDHQNLDGAGIRNAIGKRCDLLPKNGLICRIGFSNLCHQCIYVALMLSFDKFGVRIHSLPPSVI